LPPPDDDPDKAHCGRSFDSLPFFFSPLFFLFPLLLEVLSSATSSFPERAVLHYPFPRVEEKDRHVRLRGFYLSVDDEEDCEGRTIFFFFFPLIIGKKVAPALAHGRFSSPVFPLFFSPLTESFFFLPFLKEKRKGEEALATSLFFGDLRSEFVGGLLSFFSRRSS